MGRHFCNHLAAGADVGDWRSFDFLAIKRGLEPALLLPMGFGAILVNLPFTGVLNQTMMGIGEVTGIIEWLFNVGIQASEAMPLLLFVGIGAMIDFGPLFVESKAVIVRRGGAVWYFYYDYCCGYARVSARGRGLDWYYWSGGRPDVDFGVAGAKKPVHRRNCRCGVLVYGACTDYTAVCN